MFAYLSQCASCGHSLPPIPYLCDRCWKSLAREKSNPLCEDLRWPVYSVWNWNHKGSLIHQLLLRRKGCNIQSAEKLLATWAVGALPMEVSRKVDEVFYPAKSHRYRDLWRDHTSHFAMAVGNILGVRVTGVEMPTIKLYKTFGRSERSLKRLENLSVCAAYQGSSPLFVDDIVTTGATLEGLWRALGRPEQAVALSLAYKTFNPVDKI